ncbi:MAG: WD40/YVTN/BNR-like repeat-containing protein [Candidatus Omnitrophota bacterium]
MDQKRGVTPFILLFLGLVILSASTLFSIDSAMFDQMHYRHIGPQGNRVIAVTGVPGNHNICFAGAASGGLWKSSDGGINWKPVFDDQLAQSVSAVAIAPSDPNIVWAGTGETFIRSNVSIGNGIYKSTDGGETFTYMGLPKSGRIGRIVIHPKNPDIVFAAVLGHCYGPQEDRGVYRTLDGGKTWERVLFVNPETGCSDIVIDPNNPRNLFAGMWQIVIKTWGRSSGGPGSGVYVSRDGGTSWKHLKGNGLPESPLGKIGVSIAPSDSNRVYALIETGARGSLWRSDDGGVKWKCVNHSRLLNERPHYYTRMVVSSSNPNELYFPSNSMSVSLDGGESSDLIEWGGDNHDMWIDPLNADRIMIGTDIGAWISTNHGKSWNIALLPIAQMYHVSVDNQVPYFVYGNRQDGMSYRGPSNSLTDNWWGGGIGSGWWRNVAGCECGFTYPDPQDNNIVWGGCYNAGLDRYQVRTGHSRSVRVWPKTPQGSPAGVLKYRFNWTFPIAISPHDHNKVYVGSQYVHQSTDGGHSWTVISPDLSTNNKEMLGDSGGLTIDNLGVEYGCLVFAIAESPLEKGVIWAGTNDGLVHMTRDEGKTWENVTKNIPNLPPSGTISNLEPSRHQPGTCYMTVDFHQVNNRDPYIYKTNDYGKTWKLITSGIPKSVLSYAHCVIEDPKRKGLLFAGTENGLYVSFNDGENWMPFQTDLPHAPVHWLTVQEHFKDLVVATYGRGFWIMDDISPLEQMTDQVLASDVHLFSPRQAYRFRRVTSIQDYPNDQVVGKNPPYGASIHFYLKTPIKDKEGVSISISDNKGNLVRKLKAEGKAGINRVWWDLRYDPFKETKLRTRPAGNPYLWEEKRYKAYARQGYAPVQNWGIEGGIGGPLAAPGVYKITLTVNGKTYTRDLTVEKDPNTTGSLSDVEVQVKLALDIRDNMNDVIEDINQLELLRKQMADLMVVLKEKESDTRKPVASIKEVIKKAEDLDKKFFDIEALYIQPILAEGDMKSFRAPEKLYSQFALLASDVQFDSADFPPTSQHYQVYEELKKELADARLRLKDVVEKEIPAFNAWMQGNGLSGIIF